jgi:hypothetical protein
MEIGLHEHSSLLGDDFSAATVTVGMRHFNHTI